MRPHLVVLLLISGALQAQRPALPPIRSIGPIEHVTKDSLLSVSSAVPTAGGRVFVNDILARRVLLYDSSLATYTVAIDSVGPNSYGGQLGALAPFKGDSALVIAPQSLAMMVLGPSGAIARTMATPPVPSGMFAAFFANTGFDARGRMMFYLPVRGTFPPVPANPDAPILFHGPDSALVVRFDLTARKLDTIAYFRVVATRIAVNRKGGSSVSQSQSVNPLAAVDDWGVVTDGSLAIIRGRDYHVDWLGADGKWVSTARMAFDWEHLSEERKRAIIDSATVVAQAQSDSQRARTAARGARPGPPPLPILITPPEPADVADYRPPIRIRGSTTPDLDGNVWIQTSIIRDGRAVYDVVNRRGEVVDRVQFPANRRIAGFGHGVIYMSVLDSLNVAHLERARIR